MIELVEVTYHYGVRPVLRGVNLRVARGELVALMGPNGSGKSTLMGLLAGLLPPLEGRVEIDGMVRRSDPETELAIRRKVAYLPVDPFLPLTTTGREWILGVGRIYGVRDDRLFDHTDRLLALFDLEDKADGPISSYSTGQRKKVALAATLVTDAPVLLLDEPFAGGLDPSGIHALKSVLQRLAGRDDVTIVMATPVPELVQGLASRVAVLWGTGIAAYETVDAFIARTNGEARTLEEAYERFVSPQTQRNIERYFDGEEGRHP